MADPIQAKTQVPVSSEGTNKDATKPSVKLYQPLYGKDIPSLSKPLESAVATKLADAVDKFESHAISLSDWQKPVQERAPMLETRAAYLFDFLEWCAKQNPGVAWKISRWNTGSAPVISFSSNSGEFRVVIRGEAPWTFMDVTENGSLNCIPCEDRTDDKERPFLATGQLLAQLEYLASELANKYLWKPDSFRSFPKGLGDEIRASAQKGGGERFASVSKAITELLKLEHLSKFSVVIKGHTINVSNRDDPLFAYCITTNGSNGVFASVSYSDSKGALPDAKPATPGSLISNIERNLLNSDLVFGECATGWEAPAKGLLERLASIARDFELLDKATDNFEDDVQTRMESLFSLFREAAGKNKNCKFESELKDGEFGQSIIFRPERPAFGLDYIKVSARDLSTSPFMLVQVKKHGNVYEQGLFCTVKAPFESCAEMGNALGAALKVAMDYSFGKDPVEMFRECHSKGEAVGV